METFNLYDDHTAVAETDQKQQVSWLTGVT